MIRFVPIRLVRWTCPLSPDIWEMRKRKHIHSGNSSRSMAHESFIFINDKKVKWSCTTLFRNLLHRALQRARNALILIRSKRSFYLQKWIYLRGLLYLLRNETFPFKIVLRLYTDCFFNHSFSRYCENGTKSDVKKI